MFTKIDPNCPCCLETREAIRARRMRLFKKNRATMKARRDAILSGKVQVLYLRDEITGFHYRYDKKNGRTVTGGRGEHASH